MAAPSGLTRFTQPHCVGPLLPRRVAMYLVFRAAALSLADLGKAFGLKSHTSASRAIREIRARRELDPTIEVAVDGLLGQL